jgi:hypothetical protein
LPDFSWYSIPKQGKIYQIATKYTKYPTYISRGRKIYQISVKFFLCNALMKISQIAIFVSKMYHLATLLPAGRAEAEADHRGSRLEAYSP